MAENKTKPTDESVEDYLTAIEDVARRGDCTALVRMMSAITKQPPRMWGRTIGAPNVAVFCGGVVHG